jgi:hypothetical protein
MNKYEDYFQSIFAPFVDNTKQLVLKRVSYVKDFKSEKLRYILEQAYSQGDIEHKFLATLVNCVFTQTSKTFIMSSRGFIKLIKNDPNGNGMGIDFNAYKTYKRKLHDLGFIKTLRMPIGQKSGVYQLANAGLLELLNQQCSEEFFKAQEKSVLEFYDSGNSKQMDSNNETTNKPTPKPPPPPKWEDL